MTVGKQMQTIATVGAQEMRNARKLSKTAAIRVRPADYLDVEAAVALGLELSRTQGVPSLPCGPDCVSRLSNGWLTSPDYAVLVAERAEATSTEWPESVSAVQAARTKNQLGFFVGYRYPAPVNGERLASDIAMIVRPGLIGHLAAARLILRFVDWARSSGCDEAALGPKSAAIIREADIDPGWLGLTAAGPFFHATLGG